MGKITFTALVAIVLVASCCDYAQAGPRGKRNRSSGGQFSFHLESNGRILPTFNHRGRTYVEGRFGDSYQIRVRNHTGERAEVVVTVDGRDVVSGQMGDYRSQRGYVIAPYDSVLIEGFRTSYSGVAEFSFTDVPDSYAARMGDASNVGVIGVAVFKEKQYRPRPVPLADRRGGDQQLGTRYGESEASGGAASRPAQEAPSSDSDALAGAGRSSRAKQGLGTRYGNERYSPTERTTFTRRRAYRPDHILAVRYDNRQGLVNRGVLPRPSPPYYQKPAKPNPFPHSPEPGFAPPPPSYVYEQ